MDLPRADARPMPKNNAHAARALAALVAVAVFSLTIGIQSGAAAYVPAKRAKVMELRSAFLRLALRPVRWSPTPLTLTFTSTPPAGTTSTTATLSWQATFGASFRCSLDGGRASSCSTPLTLTGLGVGKHSLSVTASMRGAQTTAVASWTVQAPAPPPQPPTAGSGGSPGSGGSSSSGGSSGTSGGTGGTSGGSSSSGVGSPSAGVAAPQPPSSYSVPAGATVVSNSAQLVAALKAGPAAIVLADGVYGGSGVFVDQWSSSVYAEHVGGAVLTAGLVVGGNWGSGGATVEGLVFELDGSSPTFQDSAVNVWGASGERTRVLDCSFDGDWQVGVGLLAMNPDGLVAERLSFARFTDEGIRASDNQAVAYGAQTAVIDTISDISVDGVSRSSPGDSGGTAEAGLWIGQPVANGVRRIRIRDVAWSGIETVNNAWDTTYSDLDIDMAGPQAAIGVGVYLEHYSLNDTFTNFVLSGVKVGFNAEWDDGTPGNEAAQNDTIENGVIDASGWTDGSTSGVYLDEGTGNTTIRNVTFKNQSWTAIGAYKPAGTITITNNTYQLKPGATRTSARHV